MERPHDHDENPKGFVLIEALVVGTAVAIVLAIAVFVVSTFAQR